MKIVYHTPEDARIFDIDRFMKSLHNYYKGVTKSQVKEALKPYENNDVLHASVLSEIAVNLLPEEAAKKYYDEHQEWFSGGGFERLRRITGYLVGTLDRWNDAKRAEEADRVKHNVNSTLDDVERMAALETQAMERDITRQS